MNHCFGGSAGDGNTDEDDEAFARRLQEEADREHYARLIELTGNGTLEAAFREGTRPTSIIPTHLLRSAMPSVFVLFTWRVYFQ